MLSVSFAIKCGVIVAGYFGIRVAARWRVDRRKRESMTTPLVDPILLEATFAPHPGDDADLLAELRDTLAHLNRQAYAEEFWGLDAQIVRLESHLPKVSRATLRHALIRMLDTPDRWLQIVAAKASASLDFADAADRIRALVAAIDNADENPSEARFRDALAVALEKFGRGWQVTAMKTLTHGPLPGERGVQ